MTYGLENGLRSLMTQHALAICIYFDNLSMIKITEKILNKYSQATLIKFYKLAKLWLAKREETLIVQ